MSKEINASGPEKTASAVQGMHVHRTKECLSMDASIISGDRKGTEKNMQLHRVSQRDDS